MVEVTRMDFVNRFIETADLRILPITNLFDAGGQATDDHETAVVCIAGTKGNWVSIKLKPFSTAALH